LVITLAPDQIAEQWIVFAGLDGLGSLPMSRREGESIVAVYNPSPIGTLSAQIVVRHSQSQVSSTCEAFLPHVLD
jgi:hypothetical protein